MARLPRNDLVGPSPGPGCGGSDGSDLTDEMRCDCGSLLARWTAAGLELKCRRCKRRIIVAVSDAPPRAPPAN